MIRKPLSKVPEKDPVEPGKRSVELGTEEEQEEVPDVLVFVDLPKPKGQVTAHTFDPEHHEE